MPQYTYRAKNGKNGKPTSISIPGSKKELKLDEKGLVVTETIIGHPELHSLELVEVKE